MHHVARGMGHVRVRARTRSAERTCLSSAASHRWSDSRSAHPSFSEGRGNTMQRRAFVKSGALALVTLGLSPSFLRRTAFGAQLTQTQKGKTLICLFQRGA